MMGLSNKHGAIRTDFITWMKTLGNNEPTDMTGTLCLLSSVSKEKLSDIFPSIKEQSNNEIHNPIRILWFVNITCCLK